MSFALEAKTCEVKGERVLVVNASAFEGLTITVLVDRRDFVAVFAREGRHYSVRFPIKKFMRTREVPKCLESNIRAILELLNIKYRRGLAGRLRIELSQLLNEHIDDLLTGNEEVREPDPEVLREAEQLLKDVRILYRVKRVLDKRIVGECDVKTLLFLIALSKDVEPQSTLVIAESATGKSYLVHQIAEIFAEDVLWFTRITPAALDRMGRDLTGKVLIIEEEAGISPEAAAILRAWISEGKLRLLTTIRDESGNIKTAEIETTGRPVVISTTTRARTDEELATRIWVLTPDSSKEQTKRILEFEAALADGTLKDLGDREIEVIRAALKLLKKENEGKNVEILVPFAKRLAEKFPAERTRARRDFKKLLALIKVSAYLHQKNRPVIEEGDRRVIIATPADFVIVSRLIQRSLKPTLTGLTRDHERILRLADEVAHEIEVGRGVYVIGFTAYDLQPVLNWSRRRILDLLRDLEAWGYVEKVDGGPGRKNVYKLTDLADNGGELAGIGVANLEELMSEEEFREWLARNWQNGTGESEKNIFEKWNAIVYDPLTGEEVKDFGNLSKDNTDDGESGCEKASMTPSEKNNFLQPPVPFCQFETEDVAPSFNGDNGENLAAPIHANSDSSTKATEVEDAKTDFDPSSTDQSDSSSVWAEIEKLLREIRFEIHTLSADDLRRLMEGEGDD